MEAALRYEIEQTISELKGEIYPTNAPETSTKPYLVYMRIQTRKIKTLEGYTNKQALSYMFSIMATKYTQMQSLTKKVEDLLISMMKRNVGKNGEIYVEDLDINNIDEQYEHELKVNRGIIDFTIYY